MLSTYGASVFKRAQYMAVTAALMAHSVGPRTGPYSEAYGQLKVLLQEAPITANRVRGLLHDNRLLYGVEVPWA